jgi:hypothetical protein
MAATSLPVARLLQLRVTIAWQEAVALASAADIVSAAEAIPITLEHCHITTAGEVHLSADLPGRRSVEMSPLQLLQALLDGQAAPADLRALVATADDALASFPSEHDGDTRTRFDLQWFVSPDPLADIARLAARGLAVDAAAGAVRITASAPGDNSHPPLVRTRPRVPIERVERTRRPGVTVRVRRPSPRLALGLAAILLAVASGAAAMSGFIGGVGWPLVVSDLAAARHTPAPPVARSGAGAQEPAALEPIATQPAWATVPHAESSAASSLSEALTAEPEEEPPPVAPLDARFYSSDDVDVEPPVALRPQLPPEPKVGGELSGPHIELLIDQRGHVARVRLASPGPTVNDRMLLAAARTWEFRPATRAGHAVPYILRVPARR